MFSVGKLSDALPEMQRHQVGQVRVKHFQRRFRLSEPPLVLKVSQSDQTQFLRFDDNAGSGVDAKSQHCLTVETDL